MKKTRDWRHMLDRLVTGSSNAPAAKPMHVVSEEATMLARQWRMARHTSRWRSRLHASTTMSTLSTPTPRIMGATTMERAESAMRSACATADATTTTPAMATSTAAERRSGWRLRVSRTPAYRHVHTSTSERTPRHGAACAERSTSRCICACVT